MKKFVVLSLFLFSHSVLAANTPSCSQWPSWLHSTCQNLAHIWLDGNQELYFSGYAWHNRYTYRPEKIRSFNEYAWGAGLGKGLEDKNGNWQGLYAMAFLDSHNHIEPIAGYAYLKNFTVSQQIKIGVGLTGFVTSRVDIYHNAPLPGALPLAGLIYRKMALCFTYIPGAKGAGNVLFIFGRYAF